MIFHDTGLSGAFLVEPDRRTDDRGFFARSWCAREFAERGLDASFVQCNISFSEKRGTLRGMHFQSFPHQESKLVRCTQGALFDVIIDLRRDSPSFKRHFAVRLDSENRLSLFVPKSFAHGFQSLCDSTEVFYQMSELYNELYNPSASNGGVRWNDPAFSITWPVPDPIMNDRDRSFPDFSDEP
jgi:dTDP-4-dehydrorhamnose 3,5-epimerase